MGFFGYICAFSNIGGAMAVHAHYTNIQGRIMTTSTTSSMVRGELDATIEQHPLLLDFNQHRAKHLRMAKSKAPYFKTDT